MTPRLAMPGEGQLDLLTWQDEPMPVVSDFAPAPNLAAPEWQTQEQRAWAVVGPESVALEQRAGHLTLALDKIAASNKHQGYTKAVLMPEHRAKIEGRYGIGTDPIAEELDYKSLTGLRDARYEFFAANGQGRLALATAQTELTAPQRVVRRDLEESWSSFQRQYGETGSAARKARETFKKQLSRYVKQPAED